MTKKNNNKVYKFFYKIGSSIITFFKGIKNFFFCLKYPFYKAYNVWTGKFCGYSFTEYDNIPKGWRKAFGKKMSKEIKQTGKQLMKNSDKKLKWKDILVWEQIKEKYGTLCLYASAAPEIQDILTKYEFLSMGYCICCGKPAKYETSGYITYLCEDCLMKSYKIKDPKDIKKDDSDHRYHRLTAADKPMLSRLVDGKYQKVDLKEAYGIDFDQLWDVSKK